MASTALKIMLGLKQARIGTKNKPTVRATSTAVVTQALAGAKR